MVIYDNMEKRWVHELENGKFVRQQNCKTPIATVLSVY